jgi:hypothetical protein
MEHMNAEPEQLHAVLAIQPPRRVIFLAEGNPGQKPHLVRAGARPTIRPRHGCPQPTYDAGPPIGSIPQPTLRSVYLPLTYPGPAGKNMASRANQPGRCPRKCSDNSPGAHQEGEGDGGDRMAKVDG